MIKMVSTVEAPKKIVTAAEYLQIDRQGIRERNGKYELFNQKLIFMPGGTPQHGQLIMQIGTVLNMQKMLHKTKHRVITDTKVISYSRYKNYFYPDVFVVENEIIFDDEKKDVVTNPILVIEVLSPESTEAFDRGDKFEAYRQIPTVKEYLLISQNKQLVEQFYKNEQGDWVLKTYEKGNMPLKTMPFDIDIDTIYQDIVLVPYEY